VFKRFVNLDQPLLIKELNRSARNVLECACIYDRKFGGFQTLRQRDLETFKDIPLRPTVDCNLIIAKDPKFLRLLSTDQCLVIPSKTPIRLLVTSNDVIHSWAVPSYGVKMDAVPGRANQLLLNIPLVGTSWGQCSELCGVNHAYMPIEVKVLCFGDFLFYMELKIAELLTPYLLKYYSTRLDILIAFVNFIRENKDQPTMQKLLTQREELESFLNTKRLLSFTKK
jgi:hypothetical protein